jgi:hypothetical protein
LLNAAHEEIATEKLVMIALEYGTYPIPETLEALRAETWLVARGDVHSEHAFRMKQSLKDAFFIDEPDWKLAVTTRFLDLVRKIKGSLS